MEELLQHFSQLLQLPETLMNQAAFLPEYVKLALLDGIKIIPILFIIYLAAEFVERFFLSRVDLFVRLSNKINVLFAALLGCIPTCGTSVMASVLYSRKLITRGTLLAFLIACCDDALPLLFLDISKSYIILTILAIKIFIAFIIGFAVDYIWNFTKSEDEQETTDRLNSVNSEIKVTGCCGHHMDSESKSNNYVGHPILHTFNMFVVTVLTLSAIYYGVAQLGSTTAVGALLLKGSFLQVIVAAAIGLIPNCIVSMVLAIFYVKGLLGFGALMAGLVAVTGLGYIHLSKKNFNKNDNLIIRVILFATAIITGLLVG